MFCRRVLNLVEMVDVCKFDESYMALYSLKHVLLYQFGEQRMLCEILPPSSHLSSLTLAHCTCTLDRLYSLWLMQSIWESSFNLFCVKIRNEHGTCTSRICKISRIQL